MVIPEDLLDAQMKDYKNPDDLIGETGLLKLIYLALKIYRKNRPC